MESIPPTFQDQYGPLDVKFWVYANTPYKKACEGGIRFSFSFEDKLVSTPIFFLMILFDFIIICPFLHLYLQLFRY